MTLGPLLERAAVRWAALQAAISNGFIQRKRHRSRRSIAMPVHRNNDLAAVNAALCRLPR